jgi:hypothetical protein
MKKENGSAVSSAIIHGEAWRSGHAWSTARLPWLRESRVGRTCSITNQLEKAHCIPQPDDIHIVGIASYSVVMGNLVPSCFINSMRIQRFVLDCVYLFARSYS